MTSQEEIKSTLLLKRTTLHENSVNSEEIKTCEVIRGQRYMSFLLFDVPLVCYVRTQKYYDSKP